MAALESKFVGSLSGYVALVTGASRGIGKGIAQMICEAGATVYITGINCYVWNSYENILINISCFSIRYTLYLTLIFAFGTVLII